VRKLALDKLTYSKYCAKCQYCIKAEWAKKEGVKYGMIDVYCCAQGGASHSEGAIYCPNGVAYGVCLGTEEEFDPADWGPERFEIQKPWFGSKIEEDLLYSEEEEFVDKSIKRKKKGRRSNKGTFHGKSRGKYKQREF